MACDEQPDPGGGVRSDDDPADGFVYEYCSAFYPMATASRAIRSLELERHGLRWSHAPEVLAHPPLMSARGDARTRRPAE